MILYISNSQIVRHNFCVSILFILHDSFDNQGSEINILNRHFFKFRHTYCLLRKLSSYYIFNKLSAIYITTTEHFNFITTKRQNISDVKYWEQELRVLFQWYQCLITTHRQLFTAYKKNANRNFLTIVTRKEMAWIQVPFS